MEEQPEETNFEEAGPVEEIPEQPEAEPDITREGFTMGVSAQRDVTMNGGGAFGIAVGRDMQLSDGGAFSIAVGHDLDLTDSGAMMLRAGGDVQMKDSGIVVACSNNITASDSLIGVLLTRQTDLGEGNKVLVGTKQALAFGAAFGAVFALLGWLLRKK